MKVRKRRSTRAPLRSPGRPSVAGRDERDRFWRAIATGLSSEDAALKAGVSQAVGTKLFRKAGGMPPAMFRSSAKPLSGRYLSLAEREEIALLNVQGHSLREIGRRLGRAASTISRELDRNAATHGGGMAYRATTAQWHADRSACRPSRPSLRSTSPCALMWKTGLPVSSRPQAALAFVIPPFGGKTVGRARARIGDGLKPGAPSRLPDACRSTFRTTRRCASATKLSIKPFSFRAVER